MSEPTTVHNMAAFRKPRAVALPESFIGAAQALGLPMPYGPPSHYYLRRCKEGADVYVHFPSNRLTLCVTYQEGVTPRSFKEARAWVVAWAQRHGFTLSERSRRG